MPSLKATGMQNIINGFLRHKAIIQKKEWTQVFDKVKQAPNVIK